MKLSKKALIKLISVSGLYHIDISQVASESQTVSHQGEAWLLENCAYFHGINT